MFNKSIILSTIDGGKIHLGAGARNVLASIPADKIKDSGKVNLGAGARHVLPTIPADKIKSA